MEELREIVWTNWEKIYGPIKRKYMDKLTENICKKKQPKAIVFFLIRFYFFLLTKEYSFEMLKVVLKPKRLSALQEDLVNI